MLATGSSGGERADRADGDRLLPGGGVDAARDLAARASGSARSSNSRIRSIVSSHSDELVGRQAGEVDAESSAAAACVSGTDRSQAPGGLDSGREAVEQLRGVGAVERAVVGVERGEHRGPRLERAAPDDDPVADATDGQERRLPAGDDAGELVDAERSEVRERGAGAALRSSASRRPERARSTARRALAGEAGRGRAPATSRTTGIITPPSVATARPSRRIGARPASATARASAAQQQVGDRDAHALALAPGRERQQLLGVDLARDREVRDRRATPR